MKSVIARPLSLLALCAACSSTGRSTDDSSGTSDSNAAAPSISASTSAPTTVPTGPVAGGSGSTNGAATSSAPHSPTGSSVPAPGTPTPSEPNAQPSDPAQATASNGEPPDPTPKPSNEPEDTSTDAGTGVNVELDPDALYVAPDGKSDAAGTLDAPTTLGSALGIVGAGGTIYVRGGTYTLDTTVGLSKDGSEGAPITLSAYPLDDTRPRFDFSAMSEDSSNRGFSLSGDYWHVYGLDVVNAGDNCMFMSGSHNVIEYTTFSECADTGLQLGGGAADDLVLNCDSYFNADSSLENADGFAAKLDVGTGNKFVGCRSWNNLDDGWDGYLRPADDITTTYESCWAIDNGKLKDGSVGAGDGNGFKTGGSDDKDLRHNAVYKQCIAAGNVHDGFDHNSNRGSVTLLNCAAHDNGSNINFSTSNEAASLTIKNTISLGENGSLDAAMTDISNNSWQDGRAASADDFLSIDVELLKSPRKKDGSLPDIDYLKLVPASDLRNAGIDVGLPYMGTAPDLGAFESE